MIALLAALTSAIASIEACPRQREPAALTSAAFAVPSRGETFLFSAAQSAQSVRYALRVLRSNKSQGGTAVLIRLNRRMDCNVHDRSGEWKFKLSPVEAAALFAAAADLQQQSKNEAFVVMDGTKVEVEHYARGKLTFTYGSNGLAKERLSKIVLGLLRGKVPNTELPRADDWRYKLPGTVL